MKNRFLLLLSFLLLGLLCVGCAEQTELSPEHPVTLSMWHVYGEQADSPMNRLVSEFNEGLGKEKGIIIDVTAMTSTSKIGNMLLDAQADKPGAGAMPDLFSCHTSTATALGAASLLDWSDYFSEKELSQFVEGFIQDGMLDERLVVFPISKSTYALFINGSQFERFSADTGVDYDDLSTWDGFFSAAAQYYSWSGGKSFCALDYLIRHVELEVLAKDGRLYSEDGWYDFESSTLKESWMSFARALVQGHISVSDLYANTQVMTGETLSGIGSTAAILYFNDKVTYPDNSSEPTNLQVLPLPKSVGKEGLMPQTGVGLCAYKSSTQKAEAASVFVRWLTESQRNLDFVVDTGYMPVNNGAFDAIEDYDFPNEGYASLYSAMKYMRENYTAVIRPNYADFYERVDALYVGLRQLLPELHHRAKQGEDIEQLAEETWVLFSSIK
ncbi:MAG: extracellular solute-binding protein [Bacillota bacterium]|nr:extracellular solute-binding protein [Bacillota bacterium]